MRSPQHETGLWRNSFSYFGAILALVTGALIVVLLLADLLGGSHSTYLGILTFMVLPAFLLAGGGLFLFGMWWEHRRRAAAAPEAVAPFPVLDLNAPRQRRRFSLYLLGGAATFLVVGLAFFEAYHFTESVTFCGQVCHTVMEPEFVAHQNSPHARVACAECHIGAGTSWYVRSKLSGVRQVFATAFGTYRTPIPTPIENLRPARETCEQCHWPNKFYGGKMFVSPRYAYDASNTPRTLSMLVLIGGEEGGPGKSGGGIHWHMLLNNRVTYEADEKQQKVYTVWSEGKDGKKTEYRLVAEQGATALEQGAGASAEKRVIRLVDCVTCHNRPTHIYRSPVVNVDSALREGALDAAMPFIKRRAVEALTGEYADGRAAAEGIAASLKSYYAGSRPGSDRARGADVDRAIASVQQIYRTHFFPLMKANWRVYPDNVGHRDSPGCFRCHDGRHVSADGRAITRDCNSCHTVPALGPLQMWSSGYPSGTRPWHPWQLRGRHAAMDCDRCHDGGLPRATTCAGCHRHPADAPMADMACTDCHQDEGGQAVLRQEDCAVCHDELTGLHRKGDHKSEKCVTCHKPHGWRVAERERCLDCHDDKKEHNAGKRCASCHPFTAKK
jgi:hypothetical protein